MIVDDSQGKCMIVRVQTRVIVETIIDCRDHLNGALPRRQSKPS